MTELKFSIVSKSLNEEDFHDLESLIGIGLPDDLKNFYVMQNGGEPNLGQICHLSKETGDLFEIDYFLPIKFRNHKVIPTIEESYKLLYHGTPLFAKHCLPIATTIFGFGVYYSLEKSDFGAIYYYIHNDGEDNRFVEISRNFLSFIELLSERDSEYWDE